MENLSESMDFIKICDIMVQKKNLSQKSRVILALIYRDYLCDSKTKQKLIENEKREIQEYENELKEKYNPDKIFEKRKKPIANDILSIENEYIQEKTALIEVKENIFVRIFNKIKNIFQ